MKAIVQDTYGSPDVHELREIERPTTGDGDVLVRVHAASVNPQDWHIMQASPFIVRTSGFGLRTRKKPIRGTDVAGHVEAVGRNETRFRPGDEVFGWCEGAFAECVSVDESHLVPNWCSSGSRVRSTWRSTADRSSRSPRPSRST